MTEQSIKNLSNNDLVKSLGGYFEIERKNSKIILLHLKEIEVRKLYADLGFPDLFSMLMGYFKQSETAANQRRYALRLMDDVPEIKEHLVTGDLNLSTLALAQRQIQREEKVTGIKIDLAKKAEIVERITSKTIAQAEKELMSLLPASSKTLKTKEQRISAEEIRLSITIPDRVKEKMEILKNRWAAVNPYMDQLEIIERSLDIALAHTNPGPKKKHSATDRRIEEQSLNEEQSLKKHSATDRRPKQQSLKKRSATESVEIQGGLALTVQPVEIERGSVLKVQPVEIKSGSVLKVRPAETQSDKDLKAPLAKDRSGREESKSSSKCATREQRKTYYPRATDKILWEKANHQCEYIDTTSGRRCISKFGLERDHVNPLAKGGSNEINNLRLLCRTHNQLMARRHFGASKIVRETAKKNSNAKEHLLPGVDC